MAHSMVYFVSGDSYSDLGALKRAGIIDLHFVIHGGGSSAPSSVVADCNAAGMSPILNNGNDGSAGWNGSDSYNADIASQGWHAVGGESEQADEIDSIMNHLIFLDYGGEGTGGGTDDNVWYVTHPGSVHGYGAAGYYETYDAATNFWGWNVVGSGMLNAKSHGVKEIGIMIGTWMINHSSPQDYIQLAQDMEANGITCAGIGVWGGYGNNANNVYNQFAGWYQQFMAIWPPTNITMKNRFAGVVPTPPKPPATNATGLSHGVHSVNPSSKQVTFVGQTFAGQKPTPNNVVNFRWSPTHMSPTAAYVGNVVSDAHGNYSATVPLKTGPNFFWVVLGNGKSGRWTTDNIYI